VSDADTATDDDAGHGSEDGPDPQSAALRQQQRYVGLGGVVLSGLAVAVALRQQFPGVPVVVPAVAGVLGAGAVLWLVRRSIFP
jgi:hypothetical protein